MNAPITGRLQHWQHLYGTQQGYISLLSGVRGVGTPDLTAIHTMHFVWPDAAELASAWCDRNLAGGREVYAAAHLVTARSRRKEYAAPVVALWADDDGAAVPAHLPAPSSYVQSSPGRGYPFWRLSRPIDPVMAEQLTRRMTYAMGADRGGWGLGKLLRVVGTRNHKYPDTPSVTLRYLDDGCAYDPDELDRILPPLPEAPFTDGILTSDEPPVRLSPAALEWWHGTRQAGDRSGTLYAIAKELWRAGATVAATAAAIENRDAALGLRKYTDRPDAVPRYLETARQAAAAVEAEREQGLQRIADLERQHATLLRELATLTAPQRHAIERWVRSLHRSGEGEPPSPIGLHEPGTEPDTCEARIAALEARIAHLEAQQSRTMEVLRNPHLRPNERLTALAVVYEVDSAVSRGLDQDGEVTIRIGAIAEKCGFSPTTASRHITTLAGETVWHKRLRHTRPGQIDRETGEIFDDYDTELRIKLAASTVDTLKRLAVLQPERPAPEREVVACPNHPDEDQIMHRTVHCAVCDKLLHDSGPVRRRAKEQDDPPFQNERGVPHQRERCVEPTKRNPGTRRRWRGVPTRRARLPY